MNFKRYPEDYNHGFVGIKFPTNGVENTDGGYFNMSRTTEDQAVTNYINLLLTRKGERYMQPTFGVGLPLKLFEPNTSALRSEIESEIRLQSAIWLPYIINENIEIKERANVHGMSGTDQENAIQIVITFRVQEQGANKQITLFQTQGRIQYLVE